MAYMLDTSICVGMLRGKAPGIVVRLRKMQPGAAAISSISLAELEYGIERSGEPVWNREVVEKFLVPLAILPFDAAAAATYGRVRAALARVGTPIGPLDTLIAAHALSLGRTIITSNERKFRRVPGLTVENWLT